MIIWIQSILTETAGELRWRNRGRGNLVNLVRWRIEKKFRWRKTGRMPFYIFPGLMLVKQSGQLPAMALEICLIQIFYARWNRSIQTVVSLFLAQCLEVSIQRGVGISYGENLESYSEC